MQADNEMFYAYASGVLKSEHCAYEELDHSAVIVGYSAGTRDVEYNEVTATETWCRKKSRVDGQYSTGCKHEDEYALGTKCCWEETLT